MAAIFVKLLDKFLDICLERRQQIRLGLYILNRAYGEGNGNPQINGEYDLLESVKRKLLYRSAIFFDVGANIGEWTLAAIKGMDSQLTIYAFEPSGQAFSKLQEYLHQHKKVRIRVINMALSDKNGEAPLYMTGGIEGTNSLHKRRAEAVGVWQNQEERVSLQRGDGFCLQNGIEHIDFLKIDTEGHEMAVLRGFENMIARRCIDYIQFEYGGTWIDSRILLQDAFDFLIPRNYRIGKIHSKGVEFFDSYDPRQETFRYANYLAVQPACMEGLKRIG